MFGKGLRKDFNPKRLKRLLVVFFLALAIPTGVLVWQAYGQLKWEAFYQYRGMAEELTVRIDAAVSDQINIAEARNYTDYAFLVVSGDPSANLLQRSPLSNYPVQQDLSGVIGYFQVGANGEFSTPLLPPAGTSADNVGITSDEFIQRLQLAQDIQQVLADNQLVRARVDVGLRRTIETTPKLATTLEEEVGAEESDTPQTRARQLFVEPEPSVTESFDTDMPASSAAGSIAAESVGGFMDAESVDQDATDKLAAAPPLLAPAKNETYSQQVFDQLNRPAELARSSADVAYSFELDDASGEAAIKEQRSNALGKVADLKLDAALQKKSEVLERKESEANRRDEGRESRPARTKSRIEQSALPEAITLQSPADSPIDGAGTGGLTDLRINTFESEVDAYEFSLLGSGHFVLFRKVWRNGERYIQGILIDQQLFLRNVIEQAFRSTTLSTMSTLAVAYQDNVIATVTGRDDRGYSRNVAEIRGTLLYQSPLTEPLAGLQLIFSIDQLPAGPGASVLAWTTLVIAIVFLGGFYALYRTGLSQINLARQQQDFVSAVSHELKTPLTSIRMYGEMLKEGWADDEKRQQYYGYIHDESERLTRLITNVLQLANITRNEPQFDMKSRTIDELMSQMKSKISSQVESAGFELAFEQDPETNRVAINIDDDCFTQIIINLVDNAIKFSKDAAKKRIEIHCSTARYNTATFSIRDYGPGVPKNQMNKIFKLFYRSESELTRETVGTGIGLAIVHQLTTAMQGTIDVINKDPGAEFKVSFPIL